MAASAAGAGASLSLVALLALTAPAAIAAEADLRIEVGLGHDDNPFKAPSRPYYDQFDREVIDPEKSPGFYVPLTVDGGFLVPGKRHRFVLDYRLRQHAYTAGRSNADERYLRIAPGYQLVTRRAGAREDLFFVVPYRAYRKEIFFDRDTGVGEVIRFEDASNRYTYVATGGSAGFSSKLSRDVEWEVAARYELRDYEDVPSLYPLDHKRIQLRSALELDLARRLKLYLDHTYRVLDYDERPSRDRDGEITAGRTPLRYTYHIVGTTLRFKPAAQWMLFFDLDYTRRSDEFAGYNDYDLLGGRVRALWTTGRNRVRVAVRYRQRDYPRALIFDRELNPATGRANPDKAYDVFDGSVLFATPLRGDWSLFAEADIRRQNAADPRFTYDTLSISAGVSWVLESKAD